jgi:hypothetical protein
MANFSRNRRARLEGLELPTRYLEGGQAPFLKVLLKQGADVGRGTDSPRGLPFHLDTSILFR